MLIINEIQPPFFGIAAEWLSRPETNRWLTSVWRGQVVSPSHIALLVKNKRNRLYISSVDDIPCGLVGFSDIDLLDKTAMVWYVLGNLEFAGKGTTTEAVRQAVKMALIEMGLISIYAWIIENNIASARVLQKVGFRKVGNIRLATNYNGKQVDRIYYDIIKADCSLSSSVG